MAKIFKKLAAFALLGVVVGSLASCSLRDIEKPEWLEEVLCEHVYDEQEVLREPTCTEKGKVEKICSDCGATKIVSIPATGEHDWDEEGTCTVCGEQKQEEIENCKHTDVELKGTETVEIGTCNTCGVFLADAETIAFQGGVATGWYRLDVSDDNVIEDSLDFGGDFYVEDLNITGSASLVCDGYSISVNLCVGEDNDGIYYRLDENFELIQFGVDNYIYFYVNIEEEFSIKILAYNDDEEKSYWVTCTGVIQDLENNTSLNLIEKVVA